MGAMAWKRPGLRRRCPSALVAARCCCLAALGFLAWQPDGCAAQVRPHRWPRQDPEVPDKTLSVRISKVAADEAATGQAPRVRRWPVPGRPPRGPHKHHKLLRQMVSAISFTSQMFFLYSFGVKAVTSISNWVTADCPALVMGDIIGEWCEAWDYFFFAVFLWRAKLSFEAILLTRQTDEDLLRAMAALLSFFKRLQVVAAIMVVKGLSVHAVRFGIRKYLAEHLEEANAKIWALPRRPAVQRLRRQAFMLRTGVTKRIGGLRLRRQLQRQASLRPGAWSELTAEPSARGGAHLQGAAGSSQPPRGSQASSATPSLGPPTPERQRSGPSDSPREASPARGRRQVTLPAAGSWSGRGSQLEAVDMRRARSGHLPTLDPEAKEALRWRRAKSGPLAAWDREDRTPRVVRRGGRLHSRSVPVTPAHGRRWLRAQAGWASFKRFVLRWAVPVAFVFVSCFMAVMGYLGMMADEDLALWWYRAGKVASSVQEGVSEFLET